MRARLIQAICNMLVSTTLAIACSSPSPPSAPKGRGSAACNEWQTAICAWASKCSSPTAATCQDQANSISCISDTKAADCATALNAASCTAFPSGCNLFDLPDPAPAMAACHQFLDELCAAQVRCAPATTLDQCHQLIDATVDCTKAIGVKLTFEQCIADIKALSCQMPTSPASCMGALVSSGVAPMTQ